MSNWIKDSNDNLGFYSFIFFFIKSSLLSHDSLGFLQGVCFSPMCGDSYHYNSFL